MNLKWIIAAAVALLAIALFAIIKLPRNPFANVADQDEEEVRFISELRELREFNNTTLLKKEPFDNDPLPIPSRDDLIATTYDGPLGQMKAIASPIASSGKRRPAVVWVFGGFGSIFDEFAEFGETANDQGIASFLEKDIVLFLPTKRGEHGNPGVFECFFGEVDDIVAAVEHVAARPDVDRNRIFLMGHSTGGTNVLLASMFTDIPAGVVSFGGAPNMHTVVANGEGYGVEPYDIKNFGEVLMRSPTNYTQEIKVPVLYIEGENSFYVGDARRMEQIATQKNIPFRAAIIHGGNHFDILRPIKDLLAEQIASGSSALPSPENVQQAYDDFWQSERKTD